MSDEPKPTWTRKRPMVRLTLSPEAWERLGEIASRTGRSRSAVVEELVREAAMPRALASLEITRAPDAARTPGARTRPPRQTG